MQDRINSAFSKYDNITVVTFSELTAEFARKNGARYLLRGLRNTTDFEYENSIAQVNRYLNADLESVFLITSPQFASINSTIIREVHKYDGDVTAFLPYALV
jgi:pantetheine-phosphate adenylyltransferase